MYELCYDKIISDATKKPPELLKKYVANSMLTILNYIYSYFFSNMITETTSFE